MKIEFDMNTGIFQDDKDEEVNRILETIKMQITRGPLPTIDSNEPAKFGEKIFDVNGNTIGKWSIVNK